MSTISRWSTANSTCSPSEWTLHGLHIIFFSFFKVSDSFIYFLFLYYEILGLCNTFSSTAQRLQLASVYKGEAEKVLLVKKAEAEAEAKYLGGVGVARQRQAITDGLRENILNFSHKVEGTSAKEVMDLILITQYFDTIKDLGNSSKNTTVFIPHGPGHVRDISGQIRNGMMEAAASAQPRVTNDEVNINLLQ